MESSVPVSFHVIPVRDSNRAQWDTSMSRHRASFTNVTVCWSMPMRMSRLAFHGTLCDFAASRFHCAKKSTPFGDFPPFGGSEGGSPSCFVARTLLVETYLIWPPSAPTSCNRPSLRRHAINLHLAINWPKQEKEHCSPPFVADWEAMPQPMTSNVDSPISVASFTIADIVSSAAMIRTPIFTRSSSLAFPL